MLKFRGQQIKDLRKSFQKPLEDMQVRACVFLRFCRKTIFKSALRACLHSLAYLSWPPLSDVRRHQATVLQQGIMLAVK